LQPVTQDPAHYAAGAIVRLNPVAQPGSPAE